MKQPVGSAPAWFFVTIGLATRGEVLIVEEVVPGALGELFGARSRVVLWFRVLGLGFSFFGLMNGCGGFREGSGRV